MDPFKDQEKRVLLSKSSQRTTTAPGNHCESLKSGRSDVSDGVKLNNQERSVMASQPDQSQLDSIFTLLEDNMVAFVRNEIKKIHKCLSSDYPEISVLDGEGEDDGQTREALVKITINFLSRLKQKELAKRLQSKLCTHKLKKKLRRVFDGIFEEGVASIPDQIDTELHITKRGTAEVNDEHEVRQIETSSRKARTPEATITREDIFKLGRGEAIRTVVTKGVAGIGKTVLTRRFILDWVADRSNQNIQYAFLLTFRELNVLKEKSFSLVELLHYFFAEAEICCFEGIQVVFVLDGLDECRLPLDFDGNKSMTDVAESTSVDVLLTNLIRGTLLPSARLWITTRPAAANRIPARFVGVTTEIRGFTDPQKEELFMMKFKNEERVSGIISHIKTSRCLQIMCHIPVFCSVAAAVLEDLLETKEGELPKSLTETYIRFLVLQIKAENLKNDEGTETDPHWSPESKKMIESLGKLAFDQLQKGNLIFYESDLADCGIDITTASKYSGVFSKIFKEERGLYLKDEKVFSFIHLTFQEFLAALHVHLSFIKSGVYQQREESANFRRSTIHKKLDLERLHQSAVDEASQSPNGQLDMFLRFLLGLSLKSNQKLLRGLLSRARGGSQAKQKTIQYVKKKISEHLPAERSINLFYCLSELNDHSLVEEIRQRSGSLSTDKLSPAQWSALAFVLQSSEEDLRVFDLYSYSSSEKVLLRLLPVVKASNKALLNRCSISDVGCFGLSLVLGSQSSRLKELDLSNNDLEDSGVKQLCEGLKSPSCILESLSLSGCLITEEGCDALAAALTFNPSYLKNLDLRYNHPGETGVKLLLAALKDPKKLSVEPAGETWLKPGGLKKYSCPLSIDTNTVSRELKLSDNNRKVTSVKKLQSYPFHPDRFSCAQLLCGNVLTERYYWEVDWKGEVYISVSYRGIRRRGESRDCEFGFNDQSWSLRCSDGGRFTALHDNKVTAVSSSVSNRVAVYVDRPAGCLSFYKVCSETLVHLHTFNAAFTQALLPGFRICSSGSSITLY